MGDLVPMDKYRKTETKPTFQIETWEDILNLEIVPTDENPD